LRSRLANLSAWMVIAQFSSCFLTIPSVRSAFRFVARRSTDSGFTTTQNAALSIPASALLANDSDPDGDPLTITSASGGVNGNATFSAQTNTVTFAPTAGYTGPRLHHPLHRWMLALFSP